MTDKTSSGGTRMDIPLTAEQANRVGEILGKRPPLTPEELKIQRLDLLTAGAANEVEQRGWDLAAEFAEADREAAEARVAELEIALLESRVSNRP